MTATSYDSGNNINVVGGSSRHTPGSTDEDLALHNHHHNQAEAQPFATPNSPSSSSSTSKNNGDTTFEPTVDMMVNDFDDEQTLEEEEALAAREAEDPSVELLNLQKESEMHLDELMALYNCAATTNSRLSSNLTTNSRRITSTSSSNHEGSEEQNGEQDEDEECEDDEVDEEEEDEDEDDDGKEPSQLRKLYSDTYGINSEKRLLRTMSRQQSDEEDDGDYSPDEDEFKKTIMVGSEFQAVIPEGFSIYDDTLPYENEDKLLWDPSRVTEKLTEEYIEKANLIKTQNLSGVDAIPLGNHLRDNEKLLYILHQNEYNTEDALKEIRGNFEAEAPSDQANIWTEEECRNFESGLRMYGKEFYTIKNKKVNTRSVSELVQFYYLWKKTERHDVFANKDRLEKKKYNLQPGLTDYMDRFLEEQESNISAANTNMTTRDRTTLPVAVNYLMHGDTKCNNNSTLPQKISPVSIGMLPMEVDSNVDSLHPVEMDGIISDTNCRRIAPMLLDPLAIGDAEMYAAMKTNSIHSSNSISTNINAIVDGISSHTTNLNTSRKNVNSIGKVENQIENHIPSHGAHAAINSILESGFTAITTSEGLTVTPVQTTTINKKITDADTNISPLVTPVFGEPEQESATITTMPVAAGKTTTTPTTISSTVNIDDTRDTTNL